ncbi:VOC family protein [Pseudooceanicola sp. C21-150M6]|uniref:VOC family protein n=1 Tax=Pseudooceanicola sp. C21-150M6 TaxID=3434355 RepID=UPI003D7F60A6
MSDRATTVWTEIPVTDLDRSMEFYGKVFDWTMTRDETGPNPTVGFNAPTAGIHGHLYPGRPAVSGTGPTIHLAVPDSLSATTDRLKLAGGKVVMGPIEIPVGTFTYCEDLDGNSIGLFEAKAA